MAEDERVPAAHTAAVVAFDDFQLLDLAGPVEVVRAATRLDDDLAVDALATRVRMSMRTFARAFRRETGTTPAAYVEELRVEAARRLLESTDLTVAAIARRVGIRHAETLHRAFHRRVGTTPDRYRQHFGRRAS
jgi:transcriptional regulator GlxA family with amidase domain